MILPPVKVLPPKTQILTKLLGIAATNPFVRYNSPARQQMYTNSHIPQKLVCAGMSENFLATPMDSVLVDSTMGLRMPCRARIIKCVPRYPNNGMKGDFAFNPEVVVLYEDLDKRKLSMMSVTSHKSFHSYFGFDLIPTEHAARLVPDAIIEKGTVLYDTPGRSPGDRYMSGVMLNTAFMSHPASAEDGVVISRDVLKAFRHKRYEKRTFEWGEKTYALNTYGDENTYKIFPDIGERVREDGLIMASREIDKRLSPVDMSVNGCRRIDMTYDKLLYAKGKGGIVRDIIVTVNYDYDNKGLADTNQQLQKYIEARKRFNKQMIDEYHRLARKNPGMEVADHLATMLVQMMIDQGYNDSRFFKVFKKVAIDHVRVDFIIEYEVEPNIGYKLTETNAAKGVICFIEEPENMPVDIYGRRCDIIMSHESRTNRMNSGGLHEIYYNDAIWHVRRRLLEMMNIPFFEGITLRDRATPCHLREVKARQLATARAAEIEMLHATNRELVERMWGFVIGLYRRLSPYQAHMYDKFDEIPWKAVYANLGNIIEDAVYMEMPPDYAPDYFSIATEIREYVGFKRDVVVYTPYSGVPVTTDEPVRIASMKWLLLEKTGDTWSAVSFAKVQQYGFLAQINSSDRYSDPGRPQPIKGAGETEFRIIVSTCGQVCAAELADRNNNPRTRRQIHRTVITHATPGNIPVAVDRDQIPYGGHRGVQILHHYLNCGGIALAYTEEEGT